MSETPEQKAADFAAQFEGFSAAPYLDTVAAPPVWTIGYGSTTVNGDGETPVTADTAPIDEPTGRQWMANEFLRGAKVLADAVKVPLTVDEEAALLSFVYNVGIGAFLSSTLLRKLNAGDYAGAEAELPRWDHSGGTEVAGLLRRRLAEQALFEGKG